LIKRRFIGNATSTLETTPAVTLFVRSENSAAIALYDGIGMRPVLSYRSILLP